MLIEYVVCPRNTHGCLEDILVVATVFVDGGKQRRDNLRQPSRGGRGGGRGALGTIGGYLCFGAGCDGEALIRR